MHVHKEIYNHQHPLPNKDTSLPPRVLQYNDLHIIIICVASQVETYIIVFAML